MSLMKKLTSVFVASSLILGLVAGSVSAEWTAQGVQNAADRMRALGIVKGVDASGDLALNKSLTRAELVTIIVRAFGKEEDAKLLAGAPAYTDTANHWASGAIALAKNMIEKQGLTMGVTPTTFNPNGEVTTAEAIAFTMKFLGAKPKAGLSWPQDFLMGAVDAGILSADDATSLGAIANTKANRGLAFFMADRAFSAYKLPSGKSMYQTFVDTTPPAVTVDKYNPSTDADSVELTGTVSGATVLHVSSRHSAEDVVTPALNGKWTAKVPLKVGDNDIWIHAVDVVGNSGVPATPVKITRVAGAAAMVEATAGSQLLKAGATTDLKVMVKDKAGNEIKDAPYDVTVQGAIGTFDKATNMFTAANKPATGKLVVSSGTATPAMLDMAVVAGDLATITVEPATISLAVGQAQKFTAKGADAKGNEVPVTATWSASGGVMDAMGNFAATTGGSVTITATSGSMSGKATVTAFAPAAKLNGSNVADIVANNDDNMDLMVNIVDANGNLVANSAAAVTFTVSGAEVTVNDAAMTTVTAVNGVAKVNVKGAAGMGVGAGIITVTSPGLTGVNLAYKTVARTLTSVKLSADPAMVGNDGASTTTAKVKLYDQKGVEMAAAPAGFNIKLTSSATNIVSFGGGATTTLAAAPWQAILTAGNNLGSSTISGAVTAPDTLTGITVQSATISTSLIGAPYQLSIDTISEKASGGSHSVVVRVKDVNGNQITDPNKTVTVTLKADDVAVGAPVAGVVGVTTFTKALTTAGTITYTATATFGSTELQKATATGSVIPGDVTAVSLAFGATALSANGAHTTTLKTTVMDAAGNTVTAGSYQATFEKMTDNSSTQAFTKTSVATANGTAMVNVTSSTTPHATGDVYKVSVKISDSVTLTATAAIPTKVMGAPNKLGNITQSGSLTVGAGTKIQAEIQDGAGTLVTTDNGRTFTVTAKDAGGAVVGTYTGTTADGLAKVTVSDITKAGAYTFEFTSSGLTKATSGAYTLVAAAASKLGLSSSLTTLGNDGSSMATITIKTTDKYGNAANVASDTSVAIANSNSSLGTVAGLTAGAKTITNGSSSATFTFTAGTGLGSATFTATSDGFDSATATVNVIFVSAANKLVVNAIDNVTSGSALTFTADVQDANGNRVTGYATDLTAGATKVVVKIGDTTVTPTSITQAAGRLTITVAAADVQTAGSHAVEVSSTAITNKGTGSFTTAPGAFASVTLSASPASITANGSSTTAVTVTFADAAGNALTDASGTATLSITTGNDFATLLSNSVAISGGKGTFVVQSKTLAGTATLQAVMTYKDVDRTGTGTISVVAGAVSANVSVVSNSGMSLTVIVRDAYGNPINGLAAGAFSLREGAAASLYALTAFSAGANGAYTFTLDDTAAASGAHTLTVRTTVGGTNTDLANTVSITKP